MYTLFWEKGSGSIVVQALLEELGVTYERHYVDMEAGEHQKDQYLRQNPTGLVPALMLPMRIPSESRRQSCSILKSNARMVR